VDITLKVFVLGCIFMNRIFKIIIIYFLFISPRSTFAVELINQIANLDLFISGDSGPMHLAAAFQIPTVAIFGSTNDKETSQWMNENSMIVKKNLECQPCMSRECPLIHHNCMKLVHASDVLEAVKLLN
jgi:heptosyltransferase-2